MGGWVEERLRGRHSPHRVLQHCTQSVGGRWVGGWVVGEVEEEQAV